MIAAGLGQGQAEPNEAENRKGGEDDVSFLMHRVLLHFLDDGEDG
jgi:hypothetical protein